MSRGRRWVSPAPSINAPSCRLAQFGITYRAESDNAGDLPNTCLHPFGHDHALHTCFVSAAAPHAEVRAFWGNNRPINRTDAKAKRLREGLEAYGFDGSGVLWGGDADVVPGIRYTGPGDEVRVIVAVHGVELPVPPSAAFRLKSRLNSAHGASASCARCVCLAVNLCENRRRLCHPSGRQFDWAYTVPRPRRKYVALQHSLNVYLTLLTGKLI